MNDDTYISVKQLNDENVLFIIGESPTVTFNENVTVYTYPKVNYIDTIDTIEYSNDAEYSNDTETSNIEDKGNIISKFLKNLKNKFKI